jgi:hypothetical protein
MFSYRRNPINKDAPYGIVPPPPRSTLSYDKPNAVAGDLKEGDVIIIPEQRVVITKKVSANEPNTNLGTWGAPGLFIEVVGVGGVFGNVAAIVPLATNQQVTLVESKEEKSSSFPPLT